MITPSVNCNELTRLCLQLLNKLIFHQQTGCLQSCLLTFRMAGYHMANENLPTDLFLMSSMDMRLPQKNPKNYSSDPFVCNKMR